MKLRLWICALTGVFTITSANGRTIVVPTEAPSIQAGINAAQNGDTVMVNPGTYREILIRFFGKAVYLKSAQGLANTIIDGQNRGTIFYLTNGEGRGTIIEGFTIKNGNGRTGVVNPGGAFQKTFPGAFQLINASPTIRQNLITYNTTAFGLDVQGGVQSGPGRTGVSGGAVNVSGGGRPLFDSNYFYYNKASGNGGAITISGASAELILNSFKFNTADLGAGAIYVTPNRPMVIQKNTFISNQAKGLADPTNNGGGGAIAFSTGGNHAGISFSTISKITLNVFSQNSARFAGGAISVFGVDTEISSNNIRDNVGGQFGGGIHLESQAANGGNRTYVVKNNVIQDNDTQHMGAGISVFLETSATKVDILNNRLIGNVTFRSGQTYTTASGYDPAINSFTTAQGGAVTISGGTAQCSVIGNYIFGNQAGDFAAGYFSRVPLIFSENAIQHNLAQFRHGGVVFEANTNLEITRNYLIENKVDDTYAGMNGDRAGGFYVKHPTDTSVVLQGNRFDRNRGYFAGAILLDTVPGTALVDNNIFVNNQTLVLTCGAGGACQSAGGSFTAGSASFVASANKFLGDTYSVFSNGNATNTIAINNNSFRDETVGLAATRGVANAATYTDVNVLNATSFAQGNTIAP